eukprot:5959946-Pleurochrysis_carterae.AAC.2
MPNSPGWGISGVSIEYHATLGILGVRMDLDEIQERVLSKYSTSKAGQYNTCCCDTQGLSSPSSNQAIMFKVSASSSFKVSPSSEEGEALNLGNMYGSFNMHGGDIAVERQHHRNREVQKILDIGPLMHGPIGRCDGLT